MVYCGKPSKGCLNCRTRKTRCDQKTPACGQCIKFGFECPGYRDMLSLSFRDESSAVIRKAKSKAAKSKTTRPTETGTPSNISTTPPISPPLDACLIAKFYPGASKPCVDNEKIVQRWRPAPVANPPTFTIFPTTEELGFNYFFVNYVEKPTSLSNGYFYYLYKVFKDDVGDALTSSIVATGLACLSNVSKSAQLMAIARKKYTSAIRHINTALLSPTDSIKDCTLIAILICTVFELTAGAWMLTMKAWIEHVNGAATLIKLRGRSQFETATGLRIFAHTASHIGLSCVQREIALPPEIIELRTEFSNYRPADPANYFMKTVEELTVLRGAIKSRTLTDPTEIITSASRIDDNLTHLFSNHPPHWQYESFHTTCNPDLLYDGYYDVYQDNFVARVWNAMRTSRIMLNQIIRSALLDGLSSDPSLFTTLEYIALFQASSDNITRLRDDILHSIPQHLGFVKRKPFQNGDMDFTDLPSVSEPTQTTTPLTRDPNSPAIGGYFLLWSLFIAGKTPLSGPEVIVYVQRILRYIADEMGIAQGRNVAMVLGMTPEKERQEEKRVQGVL